MYKLVSFFVILVVNIFRFVVKYLSRYANINTQCRGLPYTLVRNHQGAVDFWCIFKFKGVRPFAGNKRIPKL